MALAGAAAASLWFFLRAEHNSLVERSPGDVTAPSQGPEPEAQDLEAARFATAVISLDEMEQGTVSLDVPKK